MTRRSLMALVTLLGAFGPALAENGDAEAVQLMHEFKCTTCHSVAAAGLKAKTKSEKLIGPDLSGYESDMSLMEMAAYLRKQKEKDGKEHKSPYKGTDEQLQTMLDWLANLEPADAGDSEQEAPGSG